MYAQSRTGRSWARTANIVNPDEVFVEIFDLSIPPVVICENFDYGALAQPLPTHLVLLGAMKEEKKNFLSRKSTQFFLNSPQFATSSRNSEPAVAEKARANPKGAVLSAVRVE